MKTKILLLIICLFFSSIIFPQSLKIGFGAEPSLLFYNNKKESSTAFIPYGINLKIIVETNNWLNIETRPGIFYGGNVDYSWFELSGLIHLNILPSKFYIITGLSDHIRGGYDDILYNGVGIGFQKDSIASFDLIFYWKTFKNNERINGILKIDISFAWDIL